MVICKDIIVAEFIDLRNIAPKCDDQRLKISWCQGIKADSHATASIQGKEKASILGCKDAGSLSNDQQALNRHWMI